MMVAVDPHPRSLGEDIAIGIPLHGQVVHIGGLTAETQEKTVLRSPASPQGMMTGQPRPLDRPADNRVDQSIELECL